MNKKNIIVLSQSDIKKNAILDIFDNEKNNIVFVEVKDNQNRSSQPIFYDGIKKACEQRMDEYFINDEYHDYIISIENGLLPIDMYEKVEYKEYKNREWCDVCLIGIETKNKLRYFTLSPQFIYINHSYSEIYFKDYYDKNSEFDTLGKYISFYENKKVPCNNWMKEITGIDRKDQIKLGLSKIKYLIDE